jgi:hypothetical protein
MGGPAPPTPAPPSPESPSPTLDPTPSSTRATRPRDDDVATDMASEAGPEDAALRHGHRQRRRRPSPSPPRTPTAAHADGLAAAPLHEPPVPNTNKQRRLLLRTTTFSSTDDNAPFKFVSSGSRVAGSDAAAPPQRPDARR